MPLMMNLVSLLFVNDVIVVKKPQGRGRGFIRGARNKNSNRMCSYCGRVGHTIETCYRNYGLQEMPLPKIQETKKTW